MPRFTKDDVKLRSWCKGPFQMAGGALALSNIAALEAHFLAEWNDDIDATMATMDPHEPFQRVPALGVDIRGVVAVRDFYLARFASWPGPVMEAFDRVTVGDTAILVEGVLRPQPGAEIGRLVGPCVVVVDFRDGLILGETVHGCLAR